MPTATAYRTFSMPWAAPIRSSLSIPFMTDRNTVPSPTKGAISPMASSRWWFFTATRMRSAGALPPPGSETAIRYGFPFTVNPSALKRRARSPEATRNIPAGSISANLLA